MDIWLFIKEAIIIVFCIKFGAATDTNLKQVFHPDPSLPKELNDFLTEVQNHKNDFVCIRELANQVSRYRRHSQHNNISPEKSKLLNQLQERPQNDIYPYMYKKSSKLTLDNDQNMNRHRRHSIDKIIEDVNIAPNGNTGLLKLPIEKYPGKVNYKRDSSNHVRSTILPLEAAESEKTSKENVNTNDGVIDKLKNIFNVIKNNNIDKRELVIDVKNDGKIIKEIHEDIKDPKSLILNFNPIKDTDYPSGTNDQYSNKPNINLPPEPIEGSVKDNEKPVVNINFPANSDVSKEKFIVGTALNKNLGDSLGNSVLINEPIPVSSSNEVSNSDRCKSCSPFDTSNYCKACNSLPQPTNNDGNRNGMSDVNTNDVVYNKLQYPLNIRKIKDNDQFNANYHYDKNKIVKSNDEQVSDAKKGFESVKSVIIDNHIPSSMNIKRFGSLISRQKKRNMPEINADDILRDYSNDNLYSYKHNDDFSEAEVEQIVKETSNHIEDVEFNRNKNLESENNVRNDVIVGDLNKDDEEDVDFRMSPPYKFHHRGHKKFKDNNRFQSRRFKKGFQNYIDNFGGNRQYKPATAYSAKATKSDSFYTSSKPNPSVAEVSGVDKHYNLKEKNPLRSDTNYIDTLISKDNLGRQIDDNLFNKDFQIDKQNEDNFLKNILPRLNYNFYIPDDPKARVKIRRAAAAAAPPKNKYLTNILTYTKILKLTKDPNFKSLYLKKNDIGGKSTLNKIAPKKTNLMQVHPKSAYIGRKLKESFDAEYSYEDYSDAGTNNNYIRDKIVHTPMEDTEEVSTRTKSEAAEGDYGDEEDSYTFNEPAKKFNKVKKTHNEFANPRTTPVREDYYDEDEEPTAEVKSVNEKYHERFGIQKHRNVGNEEVEDLVKRDIPLDDLVGFARHRHKKKESGRNKIKRPKYRVEPEIRHENLQPRIENTARKFEESQTELPLLGELQPEPIYKRDTNTSSTVIVTAGKPVATSLGATVATECVTVAESSKKYIKTTEPDANKIANQMNADLHMTTTETAESILENLSLSSVADVGECDSMGLHKSESEEGASESLSESKLKAAKAHEGHDEHCEDHAMSHQNIQICAEVEPNQNDTGNMEALVSGQLPLIIIENMFCKVNKNEKFRARFHNGLKKNRHYPTEECFGACGDNVMINTGSLIDSISALINKFLEESASCMQLSTSMHNYLDSILKSSKKPHPVECENENAEYDNHQNDMLFRKNVISGNSGAPGSNLNAPNCDVSSMQDKVKNLNGLLTKYNHMSHDCQGHAKMVKDYILDHLSMLSTAMRQQPDSCCVTGGPGAGGQPVETVGGEGNGSISYANANPLVEKQLESVGLGKRHDFQPNFNLNDMIENKKKDGSFASVNNVKKRAVSFSEPTKKYKKLADAVKVLRQKRDSLGKIANMFGAALKDKQKRNNEYNEIATVKFETPLVISL